MNGQTHSDWMAEMCREARAVQEAQDRRQFREQIQGDERRDSRAEFARGFEAGKVAGARAFFFRAAWWLVVASVVGFITGLVLGLGFAQLAGG
jgi:hypothetical protein